MALCRRDFELTDLPNSKLQQRHQIWLTRQQIPELLSGTFPQRDQPIDPGKIGTWSERMGIFQ
jgi:hypothetical protein